MKQLIILVRFFVHSLYFENRATNKSLSLKEHYNRPSDLQMNYMDHLVRGLSMQNTQKVDMLFTQTVCFFQDNRDSNKLYNATIYFFT
jgi:hypothetical protein